MHSSAESSVKDAEEKTVVAKMITQKLFPLAVSFNITI
jgi:hypothetical protein